MPGTSRTADYYVTRVRELLLEWSPAPFRDGFSTDTETNRNVSILRTINSIVADIAISTAYYKKTFSIAGGNGKWEYDVPQDCLEIQNVRYSGTHLERLQGGEQQLTEDYPRAGTFNPERGMATMWAQRDAQTILIYPVPSGSTSTGIAALSIIGVGTEPDLVNSTDTFAKMPIAYQEYIPVMAAYMLAISDPENPHMQARAGYLAPLAEDAARRLNLLAKFRSLENRRQTTKPSTPESPKSDDIARYE